MDKRFERVLLVDDDSVSNFLNEMTLQEMNISKQINISENGKEALNFLNTCSSNGDIEESNYPDLIFLDINMPVMGGFQFLEEFKKLDFQRKKHVRIVMLTSSNANRDVDKANKYKVDGYLVKPLSKDKVVEVLKIN